MKSYTFFKLMLLSILVLGLTSLQSCEDIRESDLRIQGNENSLPPELKGLKVYSVYVGGGSWMKVGVLNNKIVGQSYQVGKTTESSVLLDLSTGSEIMVESVLMENDSIIVCKKVRDNNSENY